jgi:Dyp-type peroxidase family
VVKAYGRYRFPVARYLFLHVNNGVKGRSFVDAIAQRVTTAVRWGEGEPNTVPRPKATTNIAFTYGGLKALGLPRASLMGFPEEFVMGMKLRRDILGDDGPSDPRHWDPVWKQDVHIWMSINGQTPADLEERYQWVAAEIDKTGGGVALLKGHRGAGGRSDLPFQDACILFENGQPTAKEHFGYTDGIGDPVFVGQDPDPERVIGRGKLTRTGTWEPLATGEFLLGHLDEAKEYARAPQPVELARNGTFMVYRKLHENVASFHRLLDEQCAHFPGSKELLAAKLAGRWRDNGAPIVNAPDDAAKQAWDTLFAQAPPVEQSRMLTDFTYNDDIDGAKCPVASHLRRINPRGSLQFGRKNPFDTPGALDNRRRIMRRGLPYGKVEDPTRDDGNHGIIFMALNADIGRQFEFIQQQWVNYGNDFKDGNDKEALLGNHSPHPPSKMVLRAPPGSGQPPYFVRNLPRLVECRGGGYFFVPGMMALRLIARGLVDPT